MTSSAETPGRETVFNVPNQLTAARLVLAIVVFVLIPLQQYLPALIVFAVAASTDWVDGYWARRFGQVTKLGRIFDPFVDKIIICGTFILLAVAMREIPQGIQGWMAVVVVGRELLVTALRSFIEQSGGDFSAKMSGKLKMVFQCAASLLALAVLHVGADEASNGLRLALLASVWLAVVSTVWSGLEYVVAVARVLRSNA